jgi:formylglycine-generating enzyme required for sulfatase activity
MSLRALLFSLAALTAMPAAAQSPTTTNSIGMEFVLVQPGTFVVGRFEPPFVRPAAAGGATPRVVDSGDLAALLLPRADANGDATVSRGEWSAIARSLFDTIDADRSRKLIRPVLAAGWPQALGAPAFGAPGFFEPPAIAARSTAAGVFRLADRNADDYVSDDEWLALFDNWFSDWSASTSGQLTATSLKSGLQGSVPYPQPPPALTPEEYQRIERDARAASRPGFSVRIDKPYYIGRFEVTQGEWQRVMGTTPSVFTQAMLGTDSSRHPVDSVTWEQAKEFVRRLNALEGTNAYALPTEFEWEYAARAGREGEISWTEARREAYAGIGGNRSTRPVGSMQPNPWGLHDTLGNVWEWVDDVYNGKLFADPVPPRSGTVHVLKGAGFVSDVKNATYMTHAAGPGNGFDVGFRIVKRIDRVQ